MSEGERYVGMSYDDLFSISEKYKDVFVSLLLDEGVKPGEVVFLKPRIHIGKTVFRLPIWLGIDLPF